MEAFSATPNSDCLRHEASSSQGRADRPKKRPASPRRGRSKSLHGLTSRPSSEDNHSRRPPIRLRNRPGFNSYLKVVLDDVAMQQLHQWTLDLHQNLQTAISSSSLQSEELNVDPLEEQKRTIQTFTTDSANSLVYADDDQDLTDAAASTTSSNVREPSTAAASNSGQTRPLSIKPRSLSSLHLTFFFGGETLGLMAAEALTDFHSRVSQILRPHGFHQEGDDAAAFLTLESEEASIFLDDSVSCKPTNDHESAASSDNSSRHFSVVEFRLFPPRRRNLVVALLRAPPLWHELHAAVRAAALQSPCQALRELSGLSSHGTCWLPHVTLANVVGGTASERSRLRERLEAETRRLLAAPTTEVAPDTAGGSGPAEESVVAATAIVAHARSVAMGGPVPPQVELNWTFVAREAKEQQAC